MNQRNRVCWARILVCSAILLTFPLCFLISTSVQAQYHVEVRTVDDGLPQNSVNAILQTHDGYIWLATNGGLARYDGVSFKTFDVGNTPAMTSNRILSLCEDREGSLWIGTENQGLMRLKNGELTSYPEVEEIKNRAVAGIIEAREGGLWMATATALVRLKDGVFTSYTGDYGLPAGLVPWSRSMIEDQHGDLWVALNRGLFRLAKERSTLYTTREGLPDNRVHAVCEDGDGSLWVGTERGLVRLRDGSFTTYTMKDGLSDDHITCMTWDRAGSLWVGTAAGGLMQRTGARWMTIRTADGLSDENIRCISEDREGNLWVGTTTGGLNRLREKKLKSYTKTEGFPAASIVPITQDRAGDVWIGATCGGLIRFHDGRFTTIYGMKDGLPNNCVWSLCADRDGSLWIGTWGDGLTHFKEGRFITYDPDNSAMSGRVVKAIWQGGDGALWVGTDAGLNRLQDGKFTVWRVSDGSINERINFITGDTKGALWICTNAGLSRFKDGAFTNYTTESGLSNASVRVIHEDAEGTLWMGTYGGGLNRFKDGRFTHYGTRDGLFEDTVSHILEDQNGNLWMSGNKGISRVSRKELDNFAEGRVKAITSISYGVADGMANRECNGGGQPAGWKTREGHMWFPTVKGPVVVDLGKITTNRLPPLIAIEQALINKTAIDTRRNAEIPAGKGDLEFHYTGLSFTAPEKVRFKYQLEGYDDSWVNAGARRVAYYTNVPPGQYSFRVIAFNDEGVWNESGAALTFYLRPRFYQTWWFYALAASSLAAVIVLVYKGRVRKLRKANAAQQAFSRLLIETQEAERKRIAAELHDSIGQSLAIIRNLALVGLSTPEDHSQALEQLDEVSTAASEALVEVKAVAHNLRPYQLDRLGLTKALDAMVKAVSDSSDIRFSADIAELDSVLPKGAEINLYRIVQESLNNIVKHSAATEASVIVKRDAQRILVEIRDNGRGFVPGSSGDSSAGGMGLVGIAERAKILGARCEIHSAPGKETIISINAALGELPK
ncbi:MAG TPA: two-component regulator propeller domain-containing protein [Blastocatellia bacterium]|nr:two-component regulator propeller domain-containing protein [Blastocatellia bacterium]